tara:strand:+ start:300 stop:746 length:447 start_codon:yes stop_codon:yes gene_type:complete
MRINITKKNFDINTELNSFNDKRAEHGATSIFLGKVRAESNLKEMQIDCYPEMAEKEVGNIAAIATAKWKLNAIRIVHRYGLLEPNDNIVLVITGSRHRSDCMKANEFVMDYLKSAAPFWKKEIYSDKEVWIEQNQADLSKLDKWDNT